MSTEDQRELRSFLARLRSDREILIHGVYCDIEREDGSTTRQYIPGLLRQLVSAIGNSNEQRRWARTKGGQPIVISVQAFDIMASIERVTRLWTTDVGVSVRIDRTVSELCRGSIEALPRMRHVSRHLATWVGLINELFDPPRRLHLAAPCPACGKATSRIYHLEDNEHTIVPALQIIKVDNGHICQCVACGAYWPDSHFLLLAQVLGCETIT